MSYRVVWFKRDLRVNDHAPLFHAAQAGPVVCLYVVEPSLWAQPDAAAQHLGFVRECLHELNHQLQALGATLHVAMGEVVDVLAQIHAMHPFDAVHAHEETGNAHTYARDVAVGRWCAHQAVEWHEWPQFGVVRRLKSRHAWQAQWESHMAQPQINGPIRVDAEKLPSHAPAQPWALFNWPSPGELGLPAHDPKHRQRGGRTLAVAAWQDFLQDRCASYRGGISSPLSAPTACSRLSPYLAHGCLSMREVVQTTRQTLQTLGPDRARAKRGLQGFISRLYWHCHFIQKLESEPELEWRNLHRGYDGLRENDWNETHFDAFTQGRTGWPMVDACVVMLRETGWLNFRMRAMLVSVASYPLWLHWHRVGHWLAQQFLDYEPGIHWSQMQMQAGTTGINTTRVYNPIKQALDHDPHGHFVKRWLPYMRKVPTAWLFEPWRMPDDVQSRLGLQVGRDIPIPLVDLNTALRASKARLHEVRRQPEVRAAKAVVVAKHASRVLMSPPSDKPRSRAKRAGSAGALTPSSQLTLDF